jgi:tetratricopeptide (TPR) repeat protein
MKSIVWRTCILIGIIGLLGGCSIPRRTQVETLPSASTSKHPRPLNESEGKTAVLNLPPVTEESIEVNPQDKYEEVSAENLPSMAYINDRIFEYGRKLERWKELDKQSVKRQVKEDEASEMVGCFRKLQLVLNGYSDLRNKMLRAERAATAVKMSNDSIFELEKNDIVFLEGACGRLLADAKDKGAGLNQREDSNDMTQLETLIDRYSENHEYQEVAQTWQKIPAGQIGRAHLRTKIHYGNALMTLNKEERAVEIYQQVVDQMSSTEQQATDLVSLRKILADLYMATGNYKAAIEQYKKISDDYQNLGHLEEWSKVQLSILERSKDSGPELREYSSILRDYLGYVAEKDGYKLLWQADKFLSKYPYSPVVSNVEEIKAKVKKAADRWFDTFIAGVDKLRAEKKFQEAQDLLKTVPIDLIGPDKQLALKGKNEELSLTDAVDKEAQRMALLQDLQNQWNKGMMLAKNEKFDEAIVVFSKLLETEYSVKAREKIKELSQEAAKNERKKAANLYTRFTKTSDIENRKKLLLETHKLLKSILVKYPDADIKSKVIGNIQRVEQEMMAIDPKLIVLADEDGSTSPKIDSLGAGAASGKTGSMTEIDQDGINDADQVPQSRKSF